ncbi:protein Cep78 homolog [Drosophila guanche]|uniref:Blast:Protein Cep78 homolog n=1 Tax=Drosophila guanche TaxID=7266 RepID=A0A3B0JD98_DROGU|nr:protein Cep78 homolog [Drosophila guanche]SPP78082.1 blast:Protein Cep78 homolog [Drosophila guanche]
MSLSTLRGSAAKKVTVPAVAKKSGKCRSFYFRYLELCRAQNITAVADIQKNSIKKNSLEFDVDKLNVSDWLLVNESLYNDLCLKSLVLRMRCTYQNNTIEPIDTEKRARVYTQRPVVFTHFIFRSLVHSIANFVMSNTNLTVLQLEGLPLYDGYIECIAKSLAANDSLETLSFRKSAIGDRGCEVVCDMAKYLNRISLFDISECRITAKGALHVATMIKMQKMARYAEGLKQTPDATLLLANNPNIGNEGLKLIAEALKESAWLKVVDMQGCGLTDIGVNLVLDCLKVNTSITEFNVDNNEGISQPLLSSIREQLGGTTKLGQEEDPEYIVCLFDGLHSLTKGRKYTMAELCAIEKILEEQLAIERQLRKKAEEMTQMLSAQLLAKNKSPVDSVKEEPARSPSRGEDKQQYLSKIEEEPIEAKPASIPHMSNEYLEINEEDQQESPKYLKTLFTGRIKSSAATPTATPCSELEPMMVSHFEEQQKAPQKDKQNHESKPQNEFANERHVPFKQINGDALLAKDNLKQPRVASEGAGDGVSNMIERFEQIIGEGVITQSRRKQVGGPNDGARDVKQCKQVQQRGQASRRKNID